MILKLLVLCTLMCSGFAATEDHSEEANLGGSSSSSDPHYDQKRIRVTESDDEGTNENDSDAENELVFPNLNGTTPLKKQRRGARVIESDDEEEGAYQYETAPQKAARLIRERKSMQEIQAAFPDVTNKNRIRHILEAIRQNLFNNEEDITYSEEIRKGLNQTALTDEPEAHLIKFADLVRRGKNLEEIEAEFPDANRKTLYTYASKAKTAGLLPVDATEYLDSRVELAYHHQIRDLVLRGRSLAELFAFYAEKSAACYHYRTGEALETPWEELEENEKKARLNRVFGELYEKGYLTTKHTAYLKMPDTVIGRNGETKDKILSFLNDAAARKLKAGSKAQLSELFNASAFKQIRSIKASTFNEHIKQMQEANTIPQATLSYMATCKGRTRR